MEEVTKIDPSMLSAFAELVGVHNNIERGMLLLYIIIVILTIIVFNLGFARKLSIVKTIIVYILLFIGCSPLTLLGVRLPVAEGLVITAVVLGIYRFRMYQQRKERQNEKTD
ncbi:YlaH-like protein [Schinkia azotoformans MEV2011]|uniref:YlaH-like protein n=1 Tax=Schinkia azotoformans MEV2011 TaxID=1348973 RepID=A0A072NS32_SCHAZ|nr:YlaH-like protein [Schinkia azotoformans MEV2011]